MTNRGWLLCRHMSVASLIGNSQFTQQPAAKSSKEPPRMSLRSLLASTALGVLAVTPFAASNAAPIITASTSALFGLADLNSLAAPGSPGFQNSAPIFFAGGTITFTNSSGPPNAGVYQGSVSTAKTPYPGATSTDTTNYLVAQNNDNVVFHFNVPQTSFSLLWGTVDTYNNLEFQFGGQTVTGTEVADEAGISANGSTALYVSLSNLDPFQTLTVIDIGQPAFEFVPGILLSLRELGDAVPEPASLTLLGCGLVGLVAVRARRTQGRTRAEMP